MQTYPLAPPQQSSLSTMQPTAYALSAISPVAVDLHVTNLDQSIGAKEMKTLITSVFKQHVMVKCLVSPIFNLMKDALYSFF